MKFFRLDLLTLLISLFILNSCKNQDSVGLGIVTSGHSSSSNLIDTSTVVVNTVPEDSVITSNIAKNPLGYFVDPVFGTTISTIATDLNLPGVESYTPPSGTLIIDSARLILHYADGFYGDSLTSAYTVNVYQLNEKYIGNVTYYNTRKWNYNANTVLGSLTFNARTHDSLKVYNIISGAPDTLVRVGPQIRIPIDPHWVNANLFNLSSTTLSSNAIFKNIVKGFYISVDRSKSSGPGGTLMISSNDTLSVFFHSINGSTIDTSVVNLPIQNMSSQIVHNYPQAIQNELNNQTSGSRNMFYLQGPAGLQAKISFPHLLENFRKSLLAKDSDIVINRGELVITPATGTTIPYSPLPKITMYRLDLALQRAELQDANSTGDPRFIGVTTFGGYYNRSLNEYHFVITGYLQDLMDGKTVDYGTYIAPIDTTNTQSVDIAETPQVAARTVAIGSDKSSPYRIKLNIIYTKVAKPQ